MTSGPHYRPTNVHNCSKSRKWPQSCLPAWPPFGFQLTPMCPYMVTVFWSDVVWQAASVSTLQPEWLSDLSGFRIPLVSRLALNLQTCEKSSIGAEELLTTGLGSQKWMKKYMRVRGSLHIKIKHYKCVSACSCVTMWRLFCPLQDNDQHYQIAHTDSCSTCTTFTTSEATE